jgi:hypothetical protein
MARRSGAHEVGVPPLGGTASGQIGRQVATGTRYLDGGSGSCAARDNLEAAPVTVFNEFDSDTLLPHPFVGIELRLEHGHELVGAAVHAAREGKGTPFGSVHRHLEAGRLLGNAQRFHLGMTHGAAQVIPRLRPGEHPDIVARVVLLGYVVLDDREVGQLTAAGNRHFKPQIRQGVAAQARRVPVRRRGVIGEGHEGLAHTCRAGTRGDAQKQHGRLTDVGVGLHGGYGDQSNRHRPCEPASLRHNTAS